MKLIQTDIPEVVLVESNIHQDDRGWFMESFNERAFHEGLQKLGLPKPRSFVQDNHSFSRKGVLRGLHFQLEPHAQGKLVRVVSGAVFDVAVDIRRGSPTFRKWVGVRLSAENKHMLWIPEGFAHGFISLADDTEFLYKTTDYYSKDLERSIRWDDPDLNIAWPDVDAGGLLSDKDRHAPFLKEIIS